MTFYKDHLFTKSYLYEKIYAYLKIDETVYNTRTTILSLDGFLGDDFSNEFFGLPPTYSEKEGLVFNTDLSVISGVLCGIDTKNYKNYSSFQIPFNFSEDYDLAERIQKAIFHLKNYCKKPEIEKF